MPSDFQLSRGLSFDAVAQLYAAVRPSYPRKLVERFLQDAEISSASAVLEIGPGSGKFTEFLLETGCDLTCAEPGENFVRMLEQRYAQLRRVKIRHVSFENFDPEGQKYDCICAAQAFHWVDPAERWAKTSQLLKSHGCLALIWNRSLQMNNEFFRALYDLYDQQAGGLREPSFTIQSPGEVTHEVGEDFFRSPLFEDVRVERFPWSVEYPPEDFLKLLGTYSNHLALGEERWKVLRGKIESLCSKCLSPIRKDYVALMYIGRRVDA